MLPGDVLHQSRHAHLSPAEHADDAVKGIARAAAEEHGLAVFDGRNGKEGLLMRRTTCGVSSVCSSIGSLAIAISCCTASLACSCVSAGCGSVFGFSGAIVPPMKSLTISVISCSFAFVFILN